MKNRAKLRNKLIVIPYKVYTKNLKKMYTFCHISNQQNNTESLPRLLDNPKDKVNTFDRFTN